MKQKQFPFLISCVWAGWIFLLAPIVSQAQGGNGAKVCHHEACFEKSRTVRGRTFLLQGISEYRFWGFKVYVAGLYVPEGEISARERLGEYPLQLDITYFRSLSREDFIKSGEELMKENPTVIFEAIFPAALRLRDVYEDVKPLDTYTIDFVPAQGIELFLNGVRKGGVEGGEFARAYIGIWLSRHSLSEKFTDHLWGGFDVVKD